MQPTPRTYGADAMQALIDNSTSPELKDNLLVILAGYDDDMERLLSSNAGLRSRFDKKRVYFHAWTTEQAVDATAAEIAKDGKAMTHHARAMLHANYAKLASLPGWASARDVFENVLPTLYSKRAARLASTGKALDGSVGGDMSLGAPVDLPPYEADDVSRAFESVLWSRRK
jgi:hypothetical protein